ncbi:MAG: penicillin-binding transpeptidase domain-containing protein [Phocaeicola sp.]
MSPNSKNYVTRFTVIVFLMILVGFAIVVKASIIMFKERNYWKEVADRFVKENVVVRAARGNILSSDGQLMASSLPEYRIYMDFQAGGPKKDAALMEHLDSICEGLNQIFPDKSKAEFKRHILKGRKEGKKNYLLYPNRISYIQYKEVKRLPVFSWNKFKGGFHEQLFNQRKKPFGSLAMRTLGDMYPDLELGPKNGLELYYDSLLRGKSGVMHIQKVMNKFLPIIDIPPVDGFDIVTTIDVGMQDIAEKALVDMLHEINGLSGVAVLMEVKTGDIKAIVNMTKGGDGVYREVRNNAVSDMMEPGSTFKTASLMVALEDGKITPDQVISTGGGIYNMHGSQMRDHNWHRGGYGDLTITESLMYSSNIGISRAIDENYYKNPEDFVKGLYRLGLTTPLNLDIPGAGNSIIRMPSQSNWSRTALAWMSIGYETQIPPIQTLAFYNAIANDGKMVKPRFVKSVVKNGQVVEDLPTVVLKNSIASSKTIDQIQMMLEKVVSDGLGKQAGSTQFRVAGKTGTAQVSQGREGYKNGTMHYLVSFCGYFPAEAPKYSCIVAIRKSGPGASGGLMAGGVFKKIAERVFAKHQVTNLAEAKDSVASLVPHVKHGNIANAAYVLKELDVDYSKPYRRLEKGKVLWGDALKESENIALKERDINKALVPSVIGMGARDAIFLLESVGLKPTISGVGRVQSQNISPGKAFKKGQNIHLKLTL